MSASSFLRYARYYDLLNRGKDYATEARFVDELLRADGAGPRGALLDVGCGTGAHAREFARLGWTVTGVDLSDDMLGRARAESPGELGITYVQGAAADFRVAGIFDAAVSLFHVASYQAEPGELHRMVANIRRHLRAGARFVFDFWHGPGVQADPPSRREREASDDEVRVTRVANPAHDPSQQRVEVCYEIVAEHRDGRREQINEVHRLRYYFMPEIQDALKSAGFGLERTQAGLSAERLSDVSWYGLVVARAV